MDMSNEEQLLSLRWNRFNSNLSAGFHESLCRGDLVDVTLAAEGQLVKAHRLVLSVCSPYFRKMFTQIPTNQHAFIFLKDVSHAVLVDLIQFMYCGEVKVKEDELATLISIAEALQIKGLGEESASSARLSSKSSDTIPTPIVPPKRPTFSSMTPDFAPTLKRTENIAPLESSESIPQQQILTTIGTDSNVEETKFIKMPMESTPIKSEPYYGDDDTEEVETVDQNMVYCNDDSDNGSSYMVENKTESEFIEPIAKTGDQSTNETQHDNTQNSNNGLVRYARNKRGHKMLCIDGYYFVQNTQSMSNIFWRCPRYWKMGCRATAVTSQSPNDLTVRLTGDAHSHDIEHTMDVMDDSLDNTSLPTSHLTVNNVQTENTEKLGDSSIRFLTTNRGNPMLHYKGYDFMAHRYNKTTYWRCSKYKKLSCKAKLTTCGLYNASSICPLNFPHSHEIEKSKRN